MRHILLLGAGKIGRMIARFLTSTTDYDLVVADGDASALQRVAALPHLQTLQLDADDPAQLAKAAAGKDAVISALSFAHNPLVAQAALQAGASYFDLTEDIETTRRVTEVAEKAHAKQIFMPQCGLAPGFVSIVAQHLTEQFDKLDTVHMRVGALPQYLQLFDRLAGQAQSVGCFDKLDFSWQTHGLIKRHTLDIGNGLPPPDFDMPPLRLIAEQLPRIIAPAVLAG